MRVQHVSQGERMAEGSPSFENAVHSAAHAQTMVYQHFKFNFLLTYYSSLCCVKQVQFFEEVVFAPGPSGKDNSISDPKNILTCSDTPGLKTQVVFLMENILLEITSFVLIFKGIIFSIETRELRNKLLFCNFQFLSLRN